MFLNHLEILSKLFPNDHITPVVLRQYIDRHFVPLLSDADARRYLESQISTSLVSAKHLETLRSIKKSWQKLWK